MSGGRGECYTLYSAFIYCVSVLRVEGGVSFTHCTVHLFTVLVYCEWRAGVSVTHCTVHLFTVLVYCEWRAG